MRIGKIKADTTEPQHLVIIEVQKQPKSDIIEEITGTHKYNTGSSTKRENYVSTLKNAPIMFKMNAAEKYKHTHAQTTLLVQTPKQVTSTVKHIENYINCKTTGEIL